MSETTQLSAAFRNLESREHLIFLVSREYGLVHGQGFWAGVEVSSETNAPISDPFLLRDPWPEGLRFPDQATMAALAAAHRGAWLAERIALSEREARAARLGATGAAASEAAPGEAATLARLSPTPAAARQWADLQQKLVAKARHAMAVNLDPSALILDMILKVDETASQTTTP